MVAERYLQVWKWNKWHTLNTENDSSCKHKNELTTPTALWKAQMDFGPSNSEARNGTGSFIFIYIYIYDTIYVYWKPVIEKIVFITVII